jgi:hypothetical protein
MWIELIRGLTEAASFRAPADRQSVSDAEAVLGTELPEELVSFLNETDGAEGEYSLALVWPIAKIKANNIAFRTNADFRELYMPFDHLLFFADAGNGDQFAFPVQNGKVRRLDVFVWNHEDDSRTWVAPSLQAYLEWWLTGKLKV